LTFILYGYIISISNEREVIQMAKYNLYLNGNTRIHVTGGNTKIGKGVFNISLLPSDELLTKKDGTILTNIV
jgi:hypothetical protein